MRQYLLRLFIIVILSISLWGCESRDQGSGNAVSGADLFARPVLGNQAGCKTCHSLEEGVTIVGPSLAKIAVLAAQRVEGMKAEDYLRESIIDPNAYLVEGYPADVMPKAYGKELTSEQIDSLVAYMMTLK